MLKYNHAYDEMGHRISIYDVPDEGHLNRVFTCIGCGGMMVACIGKKRKYFRHKLEEANCNKETYLHKLAKLRIKEKFDDTTKPFKISLWGETQCYLHCERFSPNNCCAEGKHPFIDLHEYYDTCELEKGVDGYIADLLLTSVEHPDRKPILIEVFVKHKCTEEKIDSGNKIIEVSVKDEDSIDTLINNDWVQRKYYEEYEENTVEATFYGFSPKAINRDINVDREYSYGFNVGRFVLYPSGKFINLSVRCNRTRERYHVNSLLELNVHSKNGEISILELAHYLRNDLKIEIKHCSICRFFYEDRYGYDHCGGSTQKPILSRQEKSNSVECPLFQLRWLKRLYQVIDEENRLKATDIEVVVPYIKQ